jgi:hypothetical protein
MASPNARRIQPTLRQHSRPEVLYDDVRLAKERLEQRPVDRGIEVEGGSELVAVDA